MSPRRSCGPTVMRVADAKVVDASAVAALIFDEPAGDWVADQIRGFDLVAPTLLPFEIANVCLVKMRRQPASREALLTALRLPGLPIETIVVDPFGAIDLAEATGLTVYDASYLWLARALGLELVTLDRELARAAV